MVMTVDTITANPDSNVPETFNAQAVLAWQQLIDRIPQMNAQTEYVASLAGDVEAAAESVSVAKWVSGSYTEGNVAWSPTDFLNYRCKNTGSRTTDPALDPTNWQLLTKTNPGGSDTTSSAVDVALTSSSGRLQIISMTASGKKVTMPSASTLNSGAPVFVLQNSGQYRFAVHRYGGAFLCYVNTGQVVALHCSDISSGAGVWQVSGQNIEQIYSGNNAEVLNAVDSRNIAVAMLSATKAICAFRDNSGTYLNAVVLNYGSSSGSPVAINAESSVDISIAAQTSAQATVVYKTSTGVTKGYVLDVSGTVITPGTVATIDAVTGGGGTAIAALSSVQLLCVYVGTVSSTPKERILDISSSAITASSEVAADATNAANYYLNVCKISASKALVAFRDASGSKVQLRLQSIIESTPAPTGSVLDLSIIPGTPFSSVTGVVVMSSSRAVLIIGVDRTYADMMIALIDISGTTPVLITTKLLRVGLIARPDFYASKLDNSNLYLSWTGAASLGIDSMVICMTGDDQIIMRKLTERVESSIASAVRHYAACTALDATHVMQICRNKDTYLSARTFEIAE